jgi:Sulfatase
LIRVSHLYAILLPLLTILLPILSLFQKNPGEVWLTDFLFLFAFLSLFMFFTLTVFFLIKKNLLKASFSTIIFFLPLSIINESHNFYLNIIVWLTGMLLAICCLFFPLRKNLLQIAQKVIFTAFLFLVCLHSISIITSKNRIRKTNKFLKNQLDSEFAFLKKNKKPSKFPLRDVYFIILDEYISPATFKNYYKYNNENFFAFLRSSHFHLVKYPYSNYPWTIPSISSMVSLRYHKNWVEKKEFPQVAHFLLRYNLIANLLKSEGYTIYSIPSIYWLGNPSKGLWKNFLFRAKSYGLVMSLLRSTPLKNKARSYQRKEHKNHIQLQLSKIDKIVRKKDEKKFVFSHILCPHRPIVFDKDGNSLKDNKIFLAEKDAMHKYYLDQAYFISISIQNIVKTILKSSSTPPLIVIVSDHGKFPIGVSGKGKQSLPMRDLSWRLSNFTALYLPDFAAPIPDYLTPVNIFRIILNQFYGYDLSLIKDVCHTHFFDLEQGLSPTSLRHFQYD